MCSDLTLSLSSLRVARSEFLPKGHCAKEQFHGLELDGHQKLVSMPQCIWKMLDLLKVTLFFCNAERLRL